MEAGNRTIAGAAEAKSSLPIPPGHPASDAAHAADATAETARFKVFISYRHLAPDQAYAQWLQSALETYWVPKPLVREHGLPPRLGRMFRDEEELAASSNLSASIEEALRASDYLIVICSPRAAASDWVNAEVKFFHELGRADRILTLLIEGEPRDAFPAKLQEIRTASKAVGQASLDEPMAPLAADVRPRPGESERSRRRTALLRIVAAILGCRFDDLRQRDQERRQRQRRNWALFASSIAIVLLGLTIVALLAVDRERDQRVLASVASAYRLLALDPLMAVDEAREALTVKKTAEGEQALRTAVEVGLSCRESRRAERAVLGSGVGYLMERWRRGDVFTRLRSDGRYALVASERGKDGPNPPGNVYLINMDNLRTKELQPGDQAKNRRLEFMGFSTSGKEIFVTRQFYLDIYNLEGVRTSSVQLEYHAKPTYLIAGMFGSYVLVGDTVGNVMLADTSSNRRPQLGGRYLDAALFIESSSDGNRAIVVFELGRAMLVVMNDPSKPIKFELVTDDTI